jgi:hypothetical protein
MAWIFSTFKNHLTKISLKYNMWQIMWLFNNCKTRFNCKCYMDGQRMNIYMLTVYIIHCPFGDVMLSHDLQLDVISLMQLKIYKL